MKKMRSINKIKKLQDEQRTSEINYRGSLPQLKNSLEKKKVSVQQIPRKAFKEDQPLLRYPFDEIIKTAENSDYVTSNLAGKPRQTFGNKSQDFQSKNNRVNLKDQLKLNNDMQGIQTNNQSSYITQREKKVLNESSEQGLGAPPPIKKHILPQANAILNATDSNSLNPDTINLDRTERTPLVEAVGSSRSESINIQGATETNIFQVSQSPLDKTHTPQGETAPTAAEQSKAVVLTSSDYIQEVKGTEKATINVGLSSQLILNQEGFDTTFNVIDTNRLDKTNEGSKSKFSAANVELEDEVEIVGLPEAPQPEIVNIKMLDHDYTDQKDILSSHEKVSNQARKSIYSNQKSRDKIDTSESVTRTVKLVNAATSAAGEQPTSGVVTVMGNTQTQFGEPAPGTIKSTQRQITKKLVPATEDLTGRTGQTYTGTVYINESANNSQGFLRVHGQHKQVDVRPKMKTHINFNQKRGKNKSPEGDLVENQYTNNYYQKSENNQQGAPNQSSSKANIKKYIAQQLRQKTPLFEMSDRGYHSNNDAYMDKISAEMYDQIIEDHIVRRGCWIPQRFKKFPRFIIFTQKDEMQEKEHLTSQFISLNPQVLALLASSDVNNISHINEAYEEPHFTSRSKNLSPAFKINSQSNDMSNSKVNFGSKKVSLKMENQLPTQQLDFNLNEVKNSTDNDFNNLQESIKLEQYMNDDNIPVILYKALVLVCQGQFQPEEVLQMLDQQTFQKLLTAANQPNAKIEDIKDQILNLLISKIKQFDPFDKVLLTKNIDNQILTSFRTLNKSNNVMSNTLKVVHQRFLPKDLAKNIKSKVPKSKVLYQLNNDIYDPLEFQKKVDGMNEDDKTNFIRQIKLNHTFDILENDLRESMEIKATQELDDNIIKSIMESKEDNSLRSSQEKLKLGLVDQQLIDTSTIELIKNRGDSKSPEQDKKAINIPYGSNKKVAPTQLKNIRIVGINEDKNASLSLQCQTQEVVTIQSDERSIRSPKKLMVPAQIAKISKREASKDSGQIELKMGATSKQENSILGGTETERAIEQISARPPLIQQPTQSSVSISMVPTPNNPLHGHLGKPKKSLKQESLQLQKNNDGTNSDYNCEIRDSPLESVVLNEGKENVPVKNQSIDEIGAPLSGSDFTFLFNPGKSREQMNPWSKNNSISKQSIDINLNTEFGIPQITGLKIKARGSVQKEEINLKVNVKNANMPKVSEPQLKKEPFKTNLQYNTDSIQVEIQNQNPMILKQKSKKFGAGFNAGVFNRSQGIELFKMEGKDWKSKGTINLNNVTNVNDIQNVISAMASETYQKQMLTTSESAVIGGGVDQIGLTREGLQIKKIINEIYRNLNKYQKRQADKDDFVTSKELIFDNSKARSLVDQLTEGVITNKERYNLDYSDQVHQNEVQMQRGPNDTIIGVNMKQLYRK